MTKDVVLEYCAEEDRAIIKMSESKMIIRTRVEQTTELLATTTGTLSVHTFACTCISEHEHHTCSIIRIGSSWNKKISTNRKPAIVTSTHPTVGGSY